MVTMAVHGWYGTRCAVARTQSKWSYQAFGRNGTRTNDRSFHSITKAIIFKTLDNSAKEVSFNYCTLQINGALFCERRTFIISFNLHCNCFLLKTIFLSDDNLFVHIILHKYINCTCTCTLTSLSSAQCLLCVTSDPKSAYTPDKRK